jgi:hypothetical protein
VLAGAGGAPERGASGRTADELQQYAAHVQVVYRRQTTELTAAVMI